MADILGTMLTTSYGFIEVSWNMLQSCIRKKNKVGTNSRFILSFFFRRAIELFESYLALIKENRLADCAILLRSFCEMGFNMDYIYENQNEKEKEYRALQYRLTEIKTKKKITEANLEDFRLFDKNIDTTREETIRQIESIKKELSTVFPDRKVQGFPHIADLIGASKSTTIKQLYTQVYMYSCSIEHHDTIYGRDYVDNEKCEPLEEIKPNTVLRPETNLIVFRFLFLVILKTFNDEFHLNWGKKIAELEARQDAEYQQFKKVHKEAGGGPRP